MFRDRKANKLWINGLNLLILNREAADYVEALINATWKISGKEAFSPDIVINDVVDEMHGKYPKVPKDTLSKDFNYVFGTLLQVAQGRCPFEDIGLAMEEVTPEEWTAPSRMDLAITYRCQNNCGFCYADCAQRKSEMIELSTEQWKRIIDILWQNGVPQIVFTGGEPLLRTDLVELVKYAEQFVTGLVTNGRHLAKIAEELHSVSLDYVQVSLESVDPNIHDKMVGATGAWAETVEGIKAAVKAGIYVTTNTTLTRENIAGFFDLIRFGKELGLKTMACNSLICSGKGPTAIKKDGVGLDEMKEILIKARELAQSLGITLEWYSPTCYNDLNPLDLGFGPKGCSAAQYNMTIEPNGGVIPCQSWIHDGGCGNILTDPWTNIWKSPVCQALREKEFELDEKCFGCEHLKVCGGGCPLERMDLKQTEAEA